MTLVIGLTGSIATGKSTLANMFKQYGIDVIDADIIAREVVELDQPAYTQIVNAFGTEILDENREIDRKKLGNIIFSDESKRKVLNSIIHPAIRKNMLKKRDELINLGPQCIVLDIPLLFESGLEDYVEKIIVAYVSKETQIKRLMERDDCTKKEALEKINTQISIDEKAERADAIIDNNGSREDSLAQLKNVLTSWNIVIK